MYEPGEQHGICDLGIKSARAIMFREDDLQNAPNKKKVQEIGYAIRPRTDHVRRPRDAKASLKIKQPTERW